MLSLGKKILIGQPGNKTAFPAISQLLTKNKLPLKTAGSNTAAENGNNIRQTNSDNKNGTASNVQKSVHQVNVFVTGNASGRGE